MDRSGQRRRVWWGGALAWAACLAGCVQPPAAPVAARMGAIPSPPSPSAPAPSAPAPSAPAAPASPAEAREMVVSGHRLASEAGLAMLRRGGDAIDAAVAAQAALGLVEPQDSGPGGGSVLLSWRAADGALTVFDGTPRAGAHATRGLNEDAAGRPLDPREVAYGGAAVGAPGTLAALFAAHKAQGRLPWAALFAPAIALAEDGFPMPPALRVLLAAPGAARTYGEAAAMYLGADGVAPPVGARLRNPAYAALLRRVARLGADGQYAEGGMAATMAALARGPRPSPLTPDDLRGAAVAIGPALCAPWRGWRVCTAPPPAYGGLLALQVLEMAGPGDLDDAGFAHRFLEAGRLAEADRRRYVGDPAQTPTPVQALLAAPYLAARAALIAPARAMPHPRPGAPEAAEELAGRVDDPGAPTTATTQVAVVDRDGNAVSLTSSLAHSFGARVVAEGAPLNNALANFAPAPPKGAHYANEMAPNKRPAAPLAPVIVFGADGRPALLGGSGGGPGAPHFVAAALIDLLEMRRAPAEALARPHLCAADPGHVTLEAGTTAERLLPALVAMGHQAQAEPLPSGSAFLQRAGAGWRGAADPRRDGVALGD